MQITKFDAKPNPNRNLNSNPSRNRNPNPSPLADPELQFRGPHGERGARVYNGGLGAEPPAGSRGQGAKPPEAESFLALGRPTDTANLHPWPVAVFSV